MPFTINAFDNVEWKRYGLADYEDFAEQISECNMGEDPSSGYCEWYFVPDEPLPNGDQVIYFGSWGNDNSPGAGRIPRKCRCIPIRLLVGRAVTNSYSVTPICAQ